MLPGPKPGTSRFVVAVQDLRQPPAAKPALPLPLPAAARLVNVVQFDASTNSAAAFTVDAPGTPGGALRRLWRVAETRGWRAVATPPAIAQPGAAIWARRGNRQMTIVALPASGRARLVLLVAGDAAGAAAMSLRDAQAGQAMTETLLASLALAAALLLPWLDGESPAACCSARVRGLSRSFQAWLFLL